MPFKRKSVANTDTANQPPRKRGRARKVVQPLTTQNDEPEATSSRENAAGDSAPMPTGRTDSVTGRGNTPAASDVENIRGTSPARTAQPVRFVGGDAASTEEGASSYVPERRTEWTNRASTPACSTPLPTSFDNRADPTMRLVEAIESTLRSVREASALNEGSSRLLSRLTNAGKLPTFSGNPLEWLHFKEAYELSSEAAGYSDRENIARLFQALQGDAREKVKILLATSRDASAVMNVLELHYGNKRFIAEKIVSDLKSMPAVDSGKISIMEFASNLKNAVAAFKSFKLTGYLYSPDLIGNISGKLPSALRYAYNRYATETIQEQSDLEKLSDFLYREAELAVKAGVFVTETQNVTPRRRPERAKTGPRPVLSGATYTMVHGEGSKDSTSGNRRPHRMCVLCNRSNHNLPECRIFANDTPQRRWYIAKKFKLCLKCLRSGHFQNTCTAKNCSVCNSRHHDLLHAPKHAAGIRVTGPLCRVDTFALLDEGSTISLIDDRTSRSIGARGPQINVTLRGIGTRSAIVSRTTRVDFDIQGQQETFRLRNVIVVKNLDLPTQSLPGDFKRKFEIGDDVDVQPYSNAQPRILLGQDNWEFIIAREVRELGNSGLAISRSRLGWAVHGLARRGAGANGIEHINSVHLNRVFAHAKESRTCGDDNLDELIKQYFCLDNLGINENIRLNNEHTHALQILSATSRRTGSLWETGLLWSKNPLPKVDSLITARKRLFSLERRLDSDPEYASLYYKEMGRLIENGYAKKVDGDVHRPFIWYLPHFGVRHKNKPRKIRLVFDAAAKTEGVSLNDLLEAGPELIQSLLGILVRFRQYDIAIKSDIEDMFMRIKVRDADRGAQRFLWRGKERDIRPDTYEMTCLVFGAKSSPCNAIYVKDKNAAEFSEIMPCASKNIIKNSYMDDFLTSCKTVREAAKMVEDVTKINARANFKMHGWASNRACVLKSVSDTRISVDRKNTRICDWGGEKVLGLFWNTETDELGFNVGLERIPTNILRGTARPSKRQVLRVIMSVFDPLGLLSPFTMQSKILMQDIWRSGINWDDELRDEEFSVWRAWLPGLGQIRQCSVPRCYSPAGCRIQNTQLHIFCDASLKAYAAVAYLRFQLEDASTHVALVAAKSRVAPLKPLTIPRLELQAALIGARLLKTLSADLDIEINSRHLWSDSMTVIRWIRTEPRTRQMFVASRLGEIEELTRSSEWRWVSSGQNPADDATRGTRAVLEKNSRWFNGPEFLKRPENAWPKEKHLDVSEKRAIDSMELRKGLVYSIDAKSLEIPTIAKFLGWEGLLVIARRVRAAANRWRGRPRVELSVDSVTSAENYWFRQIQMECFPEEVVALRNKGKIKKGSRIANLNPFLDSIGIMRAKGRVTKVLDAEFNNEPIILHGKHPAARLLITKYHRKYYHANSDTVVNEIRQRFYILGLRSVLRSLIGQCIICKFRRAKPQAPLMSTLPSGRLAYRQRPFTHCGLDYFGPMMVKIGRRREKRWGVLFTCLSVRAIHLELASSLTADSAIMALQRLAARRGSPSVIYSDNGTNFRGACKELTEGLANMNREKQRQYALANGMKWIFNPPDAPHMGGVWERLVRSVKTALNVILKEQAPSEEVLSTLLTEIEHSINSRPLTHVSIDPNDNEALTPNHFLIGTSSGEIRLPKYEAQATCLRKQWRIAQALADNFWKRWLREYLPTLIPTTKWREKSALLNVGDLVLIVDFQAPRNSWLRGTVTKVFPGSENQVRVVKIKTATGELTRPAHKIVKLISSSSGVQN